MNSSAYRPWQDVAAVFEIKPTIFEKWIHYGFVSAFRNGDGLLVIGDAEAERLKQVIRIARIGNIDPKNVLRWITAGTVSDIRLGGQWLRLTKKQVDTPPEIVFTPTTPDHELEADRQPAISVDEVSQRLDLSHTYLYRWIRYQYINAHRDESGAWLIQESEVQRNLNLADLAKYLDIGRIKIHGWIAEGTVSGVRAASIELEISRLRVDSPYQHGIQP